MKEPEKAGINFSGKVIAKNTMYNLLGYGIPLCFAVIFIPLLLKGLSTEKFGVLNIAWMIIGYASFFDFGIGKGLTKILAEKIGMNNIEEIPQLFWTSLLLMFLISTSITIVLLFFVPSLVSLFKISPGVHSEAINTFYTLAIAIPMVSTTAGLRGVLEAYQKFAAVNIIRTILGIFTFLGPFFVLYFTNSLFWIVFSLVIVRVLIWFLYLILCFSINRKFMQVILDFKCIKPVLKFSIWITISNIIGPIILYSDRFLIGAMLSAAAITYYATPYEVIAKILVVSGALTGVLFPVFSYSYKNNPDMAKKVLVRGIKFIFIIIYPIILIIITFSFEGLNLWLGRKFAENSYLILQFLSVGILMNSLSAIPNNFFQGVGKPKIPTLINTLEFPFYIVVMWMAITKWGLTGAAATYMIMAIIDALLMYTVANRLFKVGFDKKNNLFSFLGIIGCLSIPFFISNLYGKIFFILISIPLFTISAWVFFLSEDEKEFFNLKGFSGFIKSKI